MINQQAATQIAQHLNISLDSIKRCEEWVKVWFVVISGVGGRFVSKKVFKMNEDRIISEEILSNGLKLVKSRIEGKNVNLYSNFHNGGDFALRVEYKECSSRKVEVYIDGELEDTWRQTDRASKGYVRTHDSKRAKSIEGILNRCQTEGMF